jgi:HK97 family phage major capsid protein
MNFQGKSADEMAAEIKQIWDSKIGEQNLRIGEMEQRLANYRFGGGQERPSSPGKTFIQSDGFKSLADNLHAGRRVGCEVKAIITSATADADGSAGGMIEPFVDAAVSLPRRMMTIRDLVPTIRVSSGSVEYVKQTGFTNSADTVAEGDTKPQSELKWDRVTVPLRTIAHWVLASRQILDDAPQLQDLIDSELRYGLAYAEESQLLNGGGTGEDLNGIYTQATAFSAGSRVISTPNKIDVINAAIYQQNLTNLRATFGVMHPSDWTDILSIKDSAGAYIVGNPQDSAQPRLFGLPIVLTEAMTIDKFLVGNGPSATIYDRWDARVEVSTEDSDNFRKNLVTVLAEERIGLAVKNTLGFTKGDFSDAITDLTS